MSLFATMRRAIAYPHKGSAMRYLISHPELLGAVSSDRPSGHLYRSMERFLDCDLLRAVHYFLPEEFRAVLAEQGRYDTDGYRMMLYLLVRRHKPEIVVETGVARGLSSAYILQAMRDNGKGKLCSIDLPPPQAQAEASNASKRYRLADGQMHDHYEVGHLVPEYLRSFWSLHLGDARQLLPRLLEDLGEIDFFYHDSLHTYEHMKFEFETSWPKIRSGGLLLSDDVTWNAAFAEFCRTHGLRSQIFRTLGCVSKPG